MPQQTTAKLRGVNLNQSQEGESHFSRKLDIEKVPRQWQELQAFAPLNNFFETELLVGSEKQPIQFVVDTGSSWTWTTSDKCSTQEDNAGDQDDNSLQPPPSNLLGDDLSGFVDQASYNESQKGDGFVH